MTEENRSMGEKTRGRIAGTALAVIVLAAMAVGSAAPAASAACPNEAFRTGPSALLPECRAYEMVTPVDKESGIGVWEFGGAHAASSGEGVYFNSSSAYAHSTANVFNNPYVALRGGVSWDTEAIGSPQAFQGFTATYTTYGISDDLHFSLTASKEALAPGAIPFGSNLYLRDNRTDSYTLVAARPGNTGYSEWISTAQPSIPFVDASTDWSHILISSTLELAPGGVEGQPNLYEFSEGRLHLAVAEAAPAGTTEATPNEMTADGSRFFYLKGGSLFMHRAGEEPLLVSEGGGSFLGATPDGEVAFFQSTEGSLYRFEASAPPGERLTDLNEAGLESSSPNVSKGFVGEDGTTVYFAAKSQLTPDAPPLEAGEGFDLYVWHGERGQPGKISYLGMSGGFASGDTAPQPRTASVSPNGGYFGFESYAQVTPGAIGGSTADCPLESNLGSSVAGRCANVFLYSLGADRLSCVTCSGAPPAGDSHLGGKEARFENVTVPRAVLDDGTIFFDTPNALVSRDANGVRDAYSRRAGVTQLVSTGTDRDPSYFIDSTANGSNVFFATQQSLVGQDIDTSSDVYDSRTDGGLPQAGPTTAPACIAGEACRPDVAAGPSPLVSASGFPSGSGNVAGSCAALQSKARAAEKRSRSLTRQGKQAQGKRAAVLRRRAVHSRRTATQLGRRARKCIGGGR